MVGRRSANAPASLLNVTSEIATGVSPRRQGLGGHRLFGIYAERASQMAYAIESLGKDVAIDDADAARLTSLRADAVAGDGPAILVAVAGMVIGQVVVVVMLAPSAGPLFWIHASAVALAVTASVGLLIAQRLIHPDAASLVHRWLPIARKIGIFYDAAIIASPWVWLPLTGPKLAAFVYLIYAWYLAVMAIFSNDDQGDARLGLLGVPLSIAAYLLVDHGPLAAPLAIVFVASGGTLTFFERQRRRQQTEGFMQRIAASGPRRICSIGWTPRTPRPRRRRPNRTLGLPRPMVN